MTASLTPSPWRIGDAGRTIFGAPNGTPSPKTVAHVVSTRADARTVAAAPEMLEALRLIQAALAEYRLLDVRKRFSLSVAHAAAGAAIAKAEGH